MITLFYDKCKPLSQNSYDELIDNTQLHQLTCPCCENSGQLIRYGHYHRNIKTDSNCIELNICRVMCNSCNHTHALLPSDIVPYSQISFPDQLSILRCFSSSKSYDTIMQNNICLDESNIRAVISRFIHRWKEKLISAAIDIFQSSALIIKNSFAAYNMQFMQIKLTSNNLFLRPT